VAEYQKTSTKLPKFSKEYIAKRKARADALAEALSGSLNHRVLQEDAQEYANKNKSLLG
jgi:hypothetical protein